MIPLKGSHHTSDPRLDRIPSFDPKSRSFPIRTLLERSGATKPRSFTWRVPIALDQGDEGACVGFGWSHELAARPVSIHDITNDTAFALYKRAQELDEWPGNDYSGTSVLAGAKAVEEAGFLKEYRWAFGLEDVRLTIGYHGPVVLGLNWYDGMFTPQGDGRIAPTGDLAGGHCILAYSVSEKLKVVRLWNSWGPNWWHGGSWCYLTFDDLDKLLNEQGEACVPVRRAKGLPVVPH